MFVEVVKELGRGAGTVGELKLAQLPQLDEARESTGRQERASWNNPSISEQSPSLLIDDALSISIRVSNIDRYIILQ